MSSFRNVDATKKATAGGPLYFRFPNDERASLSVGLVLRSKINSRISVARRDTRMCFDVYPSDRGVPIVTMNF